MADEEKPALNEREVNLICSRIINTTFFFLDKISNMAFGSHICVHVSSDVH
jgi:hypothetical protein